MSILKMVFYLFIMVLIVAVFALVILFITSPFSGKKVEEKKHLTHIVTGQPATVEVPANGAPLVLKSWVQTKQMELLETLTRELQQNECVYWAVKTTLLGAVRHGKVMPWDDTISIAILHKDLRTLVNMRTKLQETGKALLQHGKHGYYYCTNNFSRFPFVEINIMEPKNHEISVCTPTDELGACSFEDSHLRRNEVFTYNDVFPLGNLSLGTLAMPVPNNPSTCLRTCFGANWETQPMWSKFKVVYNAQGWSLARRFFPSYF